MNLAELARLPGVKEAHLWQPRHTVSALHADSRLVRPGSAFFAMQGQRTDGHRFLPQVREAGAAALLVSDPAVYRALVAGPAEGLAGVLLVQPGREALADVAAAVYGHPSRRLRLLGVTGTNGKTTTTHLVAQLLEALGRPCGIIGSLGMRRGDVTVDAERTTPEAPEVQAFLADCVARGVGHVAMEVSSIGIALARTRALSFAGAAYTNLTQDHLDFHQSLDAYEAEKVRMFLEYEPRHAVVNVDDAAGARLANRMPVDAPHVPLTTYALDAPAELTATEASAEGPGHRGHIVAGRVKAPYTLPLPGRFNLANLLAAVGLLLGQGLPLPELAEAARHLRGAPGRFEPVAVPTGATVLVDYAHTPDAVANVLQAARRLTERRLVVVVGCGGDRDRGKRPLMAQAAEELADVVILTSDNPRSEDPAHILADMVAGLREPHRVVELVDRREAIHAALRQAGEGDVVVIAGKGHEPYQEVRGEMRPFDDRQVVRDWAAEQAGGTPTQG